MATNVRHIKKGLNLEPQGGSIVTVPGDIGYNNNTGKIEVYDGFVDSVVTEIQAATILNKTISGSNNTITNVSLTTAVSGTLPIANGGTGQTSKFAAFNALSPVTTAGDLIVGDGANSSTRFAIGANGTFLKSNGSAPVWASNPFVLPTVQKFLASSGTYTTPTGPSPLYIRVQAVGAGGGGGGSTATGFTDASSGAAGDDTFFDSSLIVASGGNGGGANTAIAGTGGSASLGVGPIGMAFTGASGTSLSLNLNGDNVVTLSSGGGGGSSPFGGAGGGNYNGNGFTATPNTGSGGGGAGSGVGGFAGSGGAAGGYVDAIIYNPGASYLFQVGVGGGGGTAGTGGNMGGAGADGFLIVTEFYQ